MDNKLFPNSAATAANLPLPALVIPDVHHRTEWAEALIAREGADCASIIFTGDYFDYAGDTPKDTHSTALWLRESLRDPRRVHLLGNHDVAYFAHGWQTLDWSGWSMPKLEAFLKVFPAEEFPSLPLHLAATAGPWFLSHAGVAGGRHSEFNGYPAEVLLHWAAVARRDLQAYMKKQTVIPQLLGLGMSRGGDQAIGGLLWCDFDMDFIPLYGVHQLCGHTPEHLRGQLLLRSGVVRNVKLLELTQDAADRLKNPAVLSQNWCLDTRGHSFAKIYPTHLHLNWDDYCRDLPAPAVVSPLWPLLTAFKLVPDLTDEPPMRVDWGKVRERFENTPAWAPLLRALKLAGHPKPPPTAPQFERGLSTLVKKGVLPAAGA